MRVYPTWLKYSPLWLKIIPLLLEPIFQALLILRRDRQKPWMAEEHLILQEAGNGTADPCICYLNKILTLQETAKTFVWWLYNLNKLVDVVNTFDIVLSELTITVKVALCELKHHYYHFGKGWSVIVSTLFVRKSQLWMSYNSKDESTIIKISEDFFYKHYSNTLLTFSNSIS